MRFIIIGQNHLKGRFYVMCRRRYMHKHLFLCLNSVVFSAPTPAPNPQWRRHRRNKSRQKRGKRRSIRTTRAASPHWQAVPFVTLTNVRSLDNKLDYIRFLWTTSKSVNECWVFVFVEIWLNDSVPWLCPSASPANGQSEHLSREGRVAAGDSVFTSVIPGAARLLWPANTALHWWSG